MTVIQPHAWRTPRSRMSTRFKAHVNVGFFRGAQLEDPGGLLEGNGKFMRHVKLRPDKQIDEAALKKLIDAAYDDMKQCVGLIVARKP